MSRAKHIDALAAIGKAFAEKNPDAIDGVVAEGVILHRDNLALEHDIRGKEGLKAFIANFVNSYDYTNAALVDASATSEGKNSAFSFWVQDNVRLKPEAAKDGITPAKEPATVSGITRVELDGEGKVTDMWYLRQLTNEEKAHRLKNPELKETGYDPHSYKQSLKADSRAMMNAAQVFNKIWATGDPAAADGIMAPDVKQYGTVFGQETHGIDGFKGMIQKVFSYWKPQGNDSTVAVTPGGNKAFIHWSSKGVELGSQEENEFYGLNVLVFNQESRITKIIGFRQPLASERKEYFKAEPLAEKL